MIDKITGGIFTAMVTNAAAAIELHKDEINELNVFPVPDGDTGTNMSLTMNEGFKECSKANADSISKACDATAGGLLRGARGNSGVILSLLFRGMAKSLKDKTAATASAFASAMAAGVTTAYNAVMKPAEGTILTVSRLASQAAVECAEKQFDVEKVLEKALEVGKRALADTVNQNPVLKKAGVVDSGGKGYIYILDGMLKALRGEVIECVENNAAAETADKADFSDFSTEDIKFTYCTEFIVERENKKDPAKLRAFLSEIGDSLVLVDDDEIIKTHVHTNDPGKVLTEALKYGSFVTVKVENMKRQHTEKVIESTEEANEEPVIAPPEKQYGMVAVCAGDGMAEMFSNVGVDFVVTGGQTMNPSTDDILKAVNAVPAETVFVLPNNKNIVMAAQQCQPLTEKKVVVIPTRSIPQGVTAALTLDTSASPEENEEAMTDAAKDVHTAQVTYAARDSEFDGHSIKSGEYLALLDGALIANDGDLELVIDSVTDKMKSFEPSVMVVYYGEDVNDSQANIVLDKVSASAPDADVTLVNGGQPVYYYVISAE